MSDTSPLGDEAHGRRIASVVIPAHNEEAVIGRLLDGLTRGRPDELEIIVVCNGCSDGTAAVAAGYDTVRVIELAEPSKRAALARGDDEATAFPRLYVDADVELSAESVARLVEALAVEGVEAAGPERTIPRDGVSPVVRWYYDVWEQLPQVRRGLFGRGVIALSEAGNERVRSLPPMMGDDLVASEVFEEHERRVVAGTDVVVYPPKRIGDLHRRRVRAATGNAQADLAGVRAKASVTSVRTVLSLAVRQPRLAPRVPIFLAFAVAGRRASRRAIRSADFDTWLRDESSRTAG